MKKLFAFLTIAALFTLGISVATFAQEQTTGEETTQTDTAIMNQEVAVDEGSTVTSTLEATEEMQEEKGFHQVLKEQFIEGGWQFMGIVLLTLIFGLALAIERIIYLNLSTTNTTKLLNKVETALQTGGIEKAKEVCKNTRGPVASIFYQGLDRYNEGLDIVEKSIVGYGSVVMGRMESGLSWISLFIALAPMLGFLGTVIGMVQAFDAIAAAGDISPTIVASGIKVALLTTVFGLIVAIVLQIFYNYILSKIDGLVNAMEDSSISFIDILTKYKSNKK
ncbi:MAG TPA: MotA/TolQ/ExbB proton channel family protein [Bacteroidales bacterium]|nr:MotA/TolQ/ExbB proton channel family protein [Bacteroidales bacterium]HPR56748.1 MotA/TolQ/ExbB proton channel family protein [Bacteroidales bacterium]HRW96568.1 MotA/TolQ/ExbB proton channel family protein [Bacteroidales bacterium]